MYVCICYSLTVASAAPAPSSSGEMVEVLKGHVHARVPTSVEEHLRRAQELRVILSSPEDSMPSVGEEEARDRHEVGNCALHQHLLDVSVVPDSVRARNLAVVQTSLEALEHVVLGFLLLEHVGHEAALLRPADVHLQCLLDSRFLLDRLVRVPGPILGRAPLAEVRLRRVACDHATGSTNSRALSLASTGGRSAPLCLICMYVCIYIYIYMYVCIIYIYIYTYMYTHNDTQLTVERRQTVEAYRAQRTWFVERKHKKHTQTFHKT